MTEPNVAFGTSPISKAMLRVVRPTDDLVSIVSFCRDGLGLQIIDQFEDPDGYRVVVQNAAWDV